jgi:DNA-binding NarL/FixJ family response regulator
MNTGPAELSNPATCRVVVVDDHAIMRDGLCAILNSEPNVEVVAVVAGYSPDGLVDAAHQWFRGNQCHQAQVP